MKLSDVYKCSICGNIVEVLHVGGGELVCCGKPMDFLEAKTEDTGVEKHKPVIEKSDAGITVKLGSVPHPMEDKHYIEWIEISDGSKTCKKFLKPADKPEAFFDIKAENPVARAYCNLHELWKA